MRILGIVAFLASAAALLAIYQLLRDAQRDARMRKLDRAFNEAAADAVRTHGDFPFLPAGLHGEVA